MLTDDTVAGNPPGLFKTTFPLKDAPPAPLAAAASVLVATTENVAPGPEPKVILVGDTVVVRDQVGVPGAAVWAWRFPRVASMAGFEHPVAVIVRGVLLVVGVEPGSVEVTVIVSVACRKSQNGLHRIRVKRPPGHC
jgi:hypothetical protein